MTRLPQPGSDKNTWGDILNGFLTVAHNADGSLSTAAVSSVLPAAGGVTAINGVHPNSSGNVTLNVTNATTLNGIGITGTPNDGQTLQYSAAGSAWVPATVTGSGTVADASANSKGIVQLAGDLGGSSAAAPSVLKINGVAINGMPASGQVIAATGSNAASWSTLAASSVGALSTSNNLSDLASASSARTNLGLGTAATISATAGGDLTGSLPSPTVASVRGITISATAPSAGQVLTAQNSSSASWVTPTGGSNSGGSNFTPTPLSAAAQVANYAFVLGNASSSGFTVTLPAAAAGAWVRVKKLDSSVNAILVVGASSSTIDGGASFSVNSQYMSQDFMSDGTNWYLI